MLEFTTVQEPKKNFASVSKLVESQSFLVTVPGEWNLEDYSTAKRKFPSVQDYIRELIRRDIEEYDKEKKSNK